MADIQGLFKILGFILKFVVFVLLILCLIFYIACDVTTSKLTINERGAYVSGNYTDWAFRFVFAYTIIMIVFLLVYLIDSTHHMFELLFLGIGMVAFVVLGVICFVIVLKDSGNAWTLIFSILILAIGIIMVVDFIREIKNK